MTEPRPTSGPTAPVCAAWVVLAQHGAEVALRALLEGEHRHPEDTAVARALEHVRLLVGDLAVLRREGRT